MSAQQWVAFFGVITVAYVIPGPDALIVLRQSTISRRAGVLAATGAQSGLCVHMLLAVAGLAALLATHPGALTVIRILGGAYLIAMGVRLMCARRDATAGHNGEAADRGPSAYLQGLLTNVTNPKAILFFVAVLPQFIDHTQAVVPQVLLLGIVDILFGFIPWTAVVFLGDRLGDRLRSPRAMVRRDTISGTALGAVGVAVTLGRF